MSLVNILMARDRAFVATDTLSMQCDLEHVAGRVLGGALKTPKIMALPHARCVIAYRANGIEVLDGVLNSLSHDFQSVDQGMRELPELLHCGVTEASRRAGYTAPEDMPELSELWSVQLFLVGWSESEQCMALAMIHYADRQQRVQRVFRGDAAWTHVLSCANGPRPGMPASVEEMAEITRGMVEAARAADAPCAKGVGGTLVVSEITPHAVAMHHCGDLGFPPYARVAHLRSEEPALVLQNAMVPAVQSTGLETEAATITRSASSSSGSTTWTPASDEGGVIRYVTLHTATLTNPLAETVVVEVTQGAYGYYTSSPATPGVADFSFEYSISGGGGSGATLSPPLGNGSSNEHSIAHSASISVPAGATLTVTLRTASLIVFGSSVTITYRNAFTRLTAVLR